MSKTAWRLIRLTLYPPENLRPFGMPLLSLGREPVPTIETEAIRFDRRQPFDQIEQQLNRYLDQGSSGWHEYLRKFPEQSMRFEVQVRRRRWGNLDNWVVHDELTAMVNERFVAGMPDLHCV